MKTLVPNLSELAKFARKVSKNLKGGETIALTGNLGAGKTTFTKLLLKSAGIKKRITSPTFVIMVPYKKGSKTFYHMDLYRTNSFKEISALGIEDLWGKKNNIFLIEWADKIKGKLPKKTIHIHFKVKGRSRIVAVKNFSKLK